MTRSELVAITIYRFAKSINRKNVKEYIEVHLALGEYVHALALVTQFKVRGYTVTHYTARKAYKLTERQLKYMVC